MSRETVRIATWNCFGAPPSAEHFFAGKPFWPERLTASAVVETLAEYDVVCVQENLLEGVRERLEHIRLAAKFDHLWFDPMGPDPEDGTFVGGGLAILSRWPLTARFTRLARGAGPDGFARKGLAEAVVRSPRGAEVALVCTHLQSDDKHVSEAATRETRTLQLVGLNRAVAALTAAGRAVIVCGDMNIAHGTDEYEAMRRGLDPGLIDFSARAGLVTYDVDKNDLAAAFHPGGPEHALVDYVWASERHFAARSVRVLLDEPLDGLKGCPPTYEARPFASDHFGVGAVLELEPVALEPM